MSIRDNYLTVMENIASACAQGGRGEGEVKLITVTKFVDTGRIAEAVAAGARHVGENRAQEFRDKLDFFKENGLDAHLIGQLQTNKVKYVIGNASLIQSVDRLELAKEISRLAVKAGITQNERLNFGNFRAARHKGEGTHVRAPCCGRGGGAKVLCLYEKAI